MTTNSFGARARRREEIAVIDMRGEVNRAAEAPLKEAYAVAVADHPTAVLLNFDAVDYINSTGIAVIVGLLAEARRDHVGITACGLSDHYKQIFEITRLSDFMTIFDREDNAVTDVPA